jgi:hypothetical protein
MKPVVLSYWSYCYTLCWCEGIKLLVLRVEFKYFFLLYPNPLLKTVQMISPQGKIKEPLVTNVSDGTIKTFPQSHNH